MMMLHTVLLAALVPLAFGEYSYTYDNTDAPTASPTAETMSPTTSGAPTRTETYAPTRMTETPSYAPTTDTYAPTQSPTATAAPTYTVPTPRPTVTGECIFPDDLVPGICDKNNSGCNATGYDCYTVGLCPRPDGTGRSSYLYCGNCIGIWPRSDEDTGFTWMQGCCPSDPTCPPTS